MIVFILIVFVAPYCGRAARCSKCRRPASARVISTQLLIPCRASRQSNREVDAEGILSNPCDVQRGRSCDCLRIRMCFLPFRSFYSINPALQTIELPHSNVYHVDYFCVRPGMRGGGKFPLPPHIIHISQACHVFFPRALTQHSHTPLLQIFYTLLCSNTYSLL